MFWDAGPQGVDSAPFRNLAFEGCRQRPAIKRVPLGNQRDVVITDVHVPLRPQFVGKRVNNVAISRRAPMKYERFVIFRRGQFFPRNTLRSSDFQLG